MIVYTRNLDAQSLQPTLPATVGMLLAALLLTAMAAPASAGVDTAALVEGAPTELTKLGHNFRVSRSSGDELVPALAYNSVDREHLAVWVDTRHEDTRGSDIFGQRIGPDGELRGRAFRISGGAATGDEREPRVVHNTTENEYLVVWADERRVADRGWEIYAQRISSEGERIGHNTRVSGARATDHEWRPDAAYNSTDNEYAVFWMDRRRPGTPGVDVFGQIIDATGDRLGHNFWITDTAQSSWPGDAGIRAVGRPAVVHNPRTNEYMVAWPDRRGKNVGRGQHIFGQRVSAGGELVAKPFRISSKRLTDNLFVVLTHDRQHARYLVVWHGDESNDFSTVFGRWIHADGRRDGPTFRITDDEAFHVRTPAVVSTAQPGRYLVAWRDDRREGTGQARVAGIFAQVVDADGDLHGDNLEIPGRNARWASGPALAHDPKTEQTLAVWSDSRRRKTSGEDIFGQLFSE